jgi:serine/threonine protein kinase/PhoPQ-activated pathogenicity-related protein
LIALEPEKLGHYQLHEKIAEGGFGEVFMGHDPRLKRDVAIKILHQYHASEPTRVARFLREARSAARLHHPGIVQVHDVVEAEGRLALVMEFVDGKTLDKHLRLHPDASLNDKLEMAAQIAETLDVAHKAGIVHRDVKPANVMVNEEGQVKLTDFSLARLLDNSMTQLTGDNNVLGTPAYMSPEQCEGLNAVPQSDLYALGVMIYEMATGSLPFEAENYLAIMRHHLDTPPTPIRLLKPTLPLDLEALISRCLSKAPEDRPATGRELARALRIIATNLPEGSVDVSGSDHTGTSSGGSDHAQAGGAPAARNTTLELKPQPTPNGQQLPPTFSDHFGSGVQPPSGHPPVPQTPHDQQPAAPSFSDHFGSDVQAPQIQPPVPQQPPQGQYAPQQPPSGQYAGQQQPPSGPYPGQQPPSGQYAGQQQPPSGQHPVPPTPHGQPQQPTPQPFLSPYGNGQQPPSGQYAGPQPPSGQYGAPQPPSGEHPMLPGQQPTPQPFPSPYGVGQQPPSGQYAGPQPPSGQYGVPQPPSGEHPMLPGQQPTPQPFPSPYGNGQQPPSGQYMAPQPPSGEHPMLPGQQPTPQPFPSPYGNGQQPLAAEQPDAAARQGQQLWPQAIPRHWILRSAVAGAAALILVALLALLSSLTSDKPITGNIFTQSDLDAYVKAPDPNYKYSEYTSFHSPFPGDGYTAYVLDMTSQTWHAENVTPPKWKHWLTVIIPQKVTSTKALLVFAEGLTDPKTERLEHLAEIAVTSNAVVAVMEGFPRDPVGFYDDNAAGDAPRGAGTRAESVKSSPTESKELSRDEFAVASFMRFVDTGDPTWPIVCPLVKSAVRAMDTVQDFTTEFINEARRADQEERKIESFVLTGAANGWGTWLTGAVDSRVAAIAPIEFDMLNIGTQIENQVGFRDEKGLSRFAVLCKKFGFNAAIDTPEGEKLLKLIDPYEYRASLTMPKLLLQPASSAMTTVDGVRFFFDDLAGPKYLAYAPNMKPMGKDPLLVWQEEELPTIPVSEEEDDDALLNTEPEEQFRLKADPEMEIHRDPGWEYMQDLGGESLTMPDVAPVPRDATQGMRDTLQVFFHKLLVDKPMPEFTWDITPEGIYRVTPGQDSAPTEVRLWIVESESRDFRYETIGPSWKMETLKPNAEGLYEGRVPEGKETYTAFYFELVFPSKLVNFGLTTPITVLSPKERPTQFASSHSRVTQYN